MKRTEESKQYEIKKKMTKVFQILKYLQMNKKIYLQKTEMDKNLDDFVLDRDKNLNFFQKLFKKDRIKEASKSLEKEQQKQEKKMRKKSNDARRTRLLAYLLILLLIVFSVVLVPFRDQNWNGFSIYGKLFRIFNSYV